MDRRALRGASRQARLARAPEGQSFGRRAGAGHGRRAGFSRKSAAILRYLARLHPQARLAGGERPREQAELDRWLSFFTGDLHPAFFPVFITQRYTTATDGASLKAVRDAGLALVRKRFATHRSPSPGPHLLSGRRALDSRRLCLSDGALGPSDAFGRPRRFSRCARSPRGAGARRGRSPRAGGGRNRLRRLCPVPSPILWGNNPIFPRKRKDARDGGKPKKF